MAIVRPTRLDHVEDDFHVRKIGLPDLRAALAQGWEDFLAKRGDLVFIGFIYPIVVLAACIYAYHASAVPLIVPLLSGSVLFGPVVACGFYELARRREAGLDARWRHFFDVFRGPAARSIAALTSLVALLFLFWMEAAGEVYSATLRRIYPDAAQTIASFLRLCFSTSEGWRMMIIGGLVGLVFALATLAIGFVSFPMLVDRRVSWRTAMVTSLRVAWTNPVTTIIWGLIVVALLMLGALPAFVGLAVVLPVLGYATWHIYKRAVVY